MGCRTGGRVQTAPSGLTKLRRQRTKFREVKVDIICGAEGRRRNVSERELQRSVQAKLALD